MKKNPSRDINHGPSNNAVTHPTWIPTFHCYVNTSTAMDHILSQINPVHTLKYKFGDPFEYYPSYTLRSLKFSPSCILSNHNQMYISQPFYTFYMSRSSVFSFGHLNNNR